jgi:RNA polymerase sigma factor (sigma-70 family)
MLVNMTANDLDLLGQFAREQSQDAFTALVNRHLNLVYSAALRQVRSPQLAEEVSQSVFANLARNATKLSPDTILTAWLYQVTRHTAIDVVRREARRQAREQIALQMSDMNDTAVEWAHIEPLLDEAMQSLDESDRSAILLRYFENKSLREVGEALGASEDAAQKRVSRAVERLREAFSKRKVTVGASGLAALVSANAIQAAPSGLAAAVATSAVTASTTISTAAIILTKTIAMTTIQKTIIATVAAAALVTASIGLYQARVISNLREQVQASKQQLAQQADLRDQVQELQRDRDRATKALAALEAKDLELNKKPNEVLKLRGEVGRLRKENADIGSTSALSKVTANPESRKMLRDQQKLGMTMIYKGFAQRAKLTPEQTEKLNDLLADHIMDNVGNVTTVLRDKPTPEQLNQIFAAQEAVLQEKVEELLGQENLAQYQDYTKGLLSTLTAEQFKSMLTGTDAAKEEKSKQMAQVLQEEIQAALAAAGLPADYQTVPILNFRNIASEQEADKSLKLLEEIYQSATGRAGSFLSPDELAKFQEFRTTAIKNNRAALTLNRTMMAPISQ